MVRLVGTLNRRHDGYERPAFGPRAKGNRALAEREQGVILAHADIVAGGATWFRAGGR